MTTRNVYLTKVTLILSAVLLLTLLLIRTSLAFENQHSTEQDEPYRVEEFDISTPGELDVQTSGGHITVEGTNDNTVRVEMFVRKDGQTLSAQDTDLDKWDITISKDGNGNAVKAIAKPTGNKKWLGGNNDRHSISFVIYTPKEISSKLKTSGGHIEVDELEGNQQISTSGGHLNLANLSGTIEAKTSGGHIDLSNIEGEINTKTSGGHINAETVTGTLNAKTSGGHIKLGDVRGSVQASTSGGSITADLNTIDQFVELKTSGGNIDISLPDGIAVDLELRGNFVDGKLNNFSGEMDDNEIFGTLNGGGPKISARTSGGGVRLSFN